MNINVPEHLKDEFTLTEKYRPQTVDDCVLPAGLKATFADMVQAGEFHNMLLCGKAGCGKTTVAKALCNDLGLESYMINSSENGNIDTLRTTIRNYASSMSLIASDKPKVVILDEADYLNPQSTQPALRGFMEEFSKTCRFILTCNFRNKILEPIQSRCTVIEFKIPKSEKPKLAAAMFSRCKQILDLENITYKDKVLAEVVNKFFPDFRRILNELQRYGVGGVIDEGILSSIEQTNVNELLSALKDKDFKSLRGWVVSNLDNDVAGIYRMLYDALYSKLEGQSYAQAVLLLHDYQYKSAFVADSELNLMACLTELMCEAQWK
jgi:DNA polymerase III delta prime subunit